MVGHSAIQIATQLRHQKGPSKNFDDEEHHKYRRRMAPAHDEEL